MQGWRPQEQISPGNLIHYPLHQGFQYCHDPALGLDLRSTASGVLASGCIISLIPRPGVQSFPNPISALHMMHSYIVVAISHSILMIKISVFLPQRPAHSLCPGFDSSRRYYGILQCTADSTTIGLGPALRCLSYQLPHSRETIIWTSENCTDLSTAPLQGRSVLSSKLSFFYTRYWYIWDSLNGTLDKIGHGTWDNVYWLLGHKKLSDRH